MSREGLVEVAEVVRNVAEATMVEEQEGSQAVEAAEIVCDAVKATAVEEQKGPQAAEALGLGRVCSAACQLRRRGVRLRVPPGVRGRGADSRRGRGGARVRSGGES